MSFQWSNSTDRLFRRCQRQFFFREIAGHHAANEEWRREAYVLKQLKSLEAWRGSVIHEGIEHYLVPVLKQGRPIDWGEISERTIQRAKAQLAFSAAKRYRESGVTKTGREEFCALLPDETGSGVSPEQFAGICEGIKIAFANMAVREKFWAALRGKRSLQAEKQYWVEFDEVKIQVKIDLLFERSPGKPTIVDWKSYEIGGDGDARLQTLLYGWALWKKNPFGIQSQEDIQLLEFQVQDAALITHECSQVAFDELEDFIYRSINRIFSLCRSKKLMEVRLEDFAFTENPNNCEYCAFQKLCVAKSSAAAKPVAAADQPDRAARPASASL